jgi:ubiquitin carboxyl-terminal hydrolase L3
MPQKHYLPLESNPDVFTRLIRNLGVSSLSFHDVLSLTEPELLDWIPRPVLALVLVLPTTKKYEEDVALEEAKRNVYTGHGDNEDVVWFRQTIGNACGLYAILHALCNGEATQSIRSSRLSGRSDKMLKS